MFELCVLDVIVGFVLCLYCGPNRRQISFSVLQKAHPKNLFDFATPGIIPLTPMAISSTTRVGPFRSNVLLSQTAFCQLPFTPMNWFRKRKRKNNYRYCRACSTSCTQERKSRGLIVVGNFAKDGETVIAIYQDHGSIALSLECFLSDQSQQRLV